MSQYKKCLDKFLEKPARNDLTFQDLKTILSGLGFTIQERAGSRVAFIKEGEDPILLHKPHPGNEIKAYMVRELQEHIKKLIDKQK